MKRFALLAALAVWAPSPSSACVNSFTSRALELHDPKDPARNAQIVAEAEEQWRRAPTLENTNDLAVTMILTGRAAESIELLRELEKRSPGNAKIAANLGTALELTGSDQEALLWIREAVRRDPREHAGSEWVHVKILEAKLALKRDRNWLRTHSVVGWREGQQLLADERGLVRSPMELWTPINHQIRERTRFVEAPDAIVGDLYLTLGDIAHSYPGAFANGWERDAAESANYRWALHFGTVHQVRARARMEAADRRIEASAPERAAAAMRERQAEEQAAKKLERQRAEEQRRIERREEQVRRRKLALWVFLSFGAVIAAAVWWRRKRAAG